MKMENNKNFITIPSTETEKLINSSNDKSFPAKSILYPTDGIGDKDYYIISQQAVEGLYWDYYLRLVIIYLIIILFILLISLISEYNIKLYFVKKLPFGNYLYLVLNKLKDLWSKTTIIWKSFILFIILIGTCILTWSLYMVINNLG